MLINFNNVETKLPCAVIFGDDCQLEVKPITYDDEDNTEKITYALWYKKIGRLHDVCVKLFQSEDELKVCRMYLDCVQAYADGATIFNVLDVYN